MPSLKATVVDPRKCGKRKQVAISKEKKVYALVDLPNDIADEFCCLINGETKPKCSTT